MHLWIVAHFQGLLLFCLELIIVNEALQKAKWFLVNINTFKEVLCVNTVFSLSDSFQFLQEVLSKVFSSSGHGCDSLCLWRIELILFHDGFYSIKREKELIIPDISILVPFWVLYHLRGHIQVKPKEIYSKYYFSFFLLYSSSNYLF
jgi:hypothetical protein